MLKGLDIYRGKGRINWDKVTPKPDFVIAKIGEGTSLKDTQFDNNYSGCKKAGIPIGAYHFSRAVTLEQAKAEADAFISWAKGKAFEYPVYLDCECAAQAALDKNLLTEIINVWLIAVRAAGYTPGLYTNPSWLKDHINPKKLQPCEMWIAHWAKSSPTAESYGGLWQYTDSLYWEGIGYVDGNISYKDYAAITASKTTPAAPKAPEPPPYYPACSKYTGVSIVDALRSIGVDASFAHRTKIAKANGITLYLGTASQNVTLLNLLKAGKLKKP
jgi:lysozyme